MHYVYRITNIDKHKHYYGTRSTDISPINDIGKKYFSSSVDKDFVNEQKENPNNYKYKIIKVFDNRKNAIELEIKLHKRFDVASNTSFYNRSRQVSTGFDTTGTTYSHKESTKQKIKKSRAKQIFSDNDKLKMSLSNIEYKKIHGHGKKAFVVNVFDNDDNLVFTSKGTLKEDCEQQGLSYNAIRNSYISGDKIYLNGLAGIKKEFQKFKGYYAIRVK